MPDNVIKTDIQDYWRRSYVGGKEIPSSNVVVDGEEKSRVFVGDKEANIVFVGDKVAYAKHKENIILSQVYNKSSTVSVNLNNGTFKFTRDLSVTDNYLGLKNAQVLNVGENISLSFDVSDFYSPNGRWWRFYSTEFGYSKSITIDHAGHYSISGVAQRYIGVDYGASIIDDRDNTMDAGDYFIIKNIKLERNIVDTGYSLAPSVTPQNRVKIGKHYYHTCTIGSQEWLSENLNEDLKDVVVKDVDWRCALQSGVILTNVDLGSTITLSRNSSADWYSCWFPVSEGETITYGGYGAYNASVVCLLDAENKLLWKSNSDIRDYNQTTVVPSGAVTCLFQSKESGENYGKPGKCIQSTHTSEGTWEGYYNNDPSYGVKGYGKLYTWDCLCSANETPSAAMAALLKDGWRVPTKADLLALSQVSGITASKIKEKWTWGGTNVGTNELGFSAMSCGYRMSADGAFSSIDTRCIIHSSSVSTTNSAFTVDLSIREATALYNDESSKNLCRSIRLVRDVPVTLSAPPTTGSAYVASVDGNVGWVSE